MTPRRLLKRLAASQTNVRFADVLRLARALGFIEDRVSGSHHILIHHRHREAQLNLQADRGQAKPYQIKQLLKLVEEYNVSFDEEA